MHYTLPADIRLHPDYENLKREGKLENPSPSLIEDLLEENRQFYQSVDADSVVHRLNNIVAEIGKMLVNRTTITRQGLRALMTSEHQFIFSGAGVAKSLYANQIFSFFKAARTFSIQFCPDTTPDDLFGAYDIEKFKKGEVVHNIEGSIISKPFAFLDEFMDGNDKLLRTLLGVLLERRFIAGNQVEEAMLHTAIATSNYMRMSETTEALLDRFLYKSFINPAKDMYTLLRIDQVYNRNAGQIQKPDPGRLIDLRELTAIKRIIRNQDEHRSIHCPIEIQYLKNMVVSSYESEMKKYRSGYYISPRTISKGNDCLKANAMLAGRKTVIEEDVEKLYYLFCTMNEPLDEGRTLLSQKLFKKVFRSRLQYFHSFQDELRPLLYTFEFLQEAHRNPGLLDKPIEDLQDGSKGWLPDLVSSLRQAFGHREDIPFDHSRSSFLKLIEPCGEKNQELYDFKKQVLDLMDLVYGRG
jgi:MoxR-like ATPase